VVLLLLVGHLGIVIDLIDIVVVVVVVPLVIVDR
jgi:hypothetical protein